MVAITWINLVIYLIALSLIKVSLGSMKISENSALEERQKRSIDPNFLRRYNHLKYEYRNNPIAFDFLKYFLRNRGQKRERRQINNQFASNGFDNGFVTYRNPNRASTPRTKDNKREVVTKRKPFRPPMVFF